MNVAAKGDEAGASPAAFGSGVAMTDFSFPIVSRFLLQVNHGLHVFQGIIHKRHGGGGAPSPVAQRNHESHGFHRSDGKVSGVPRGFFAVLVGLALLIDMLPGLRSFAQAPSIALTCAARPGGRLLFGFP